MSQAFADCFPPKAGRAHEVGGPGADVFAAIVCGLGDGEALWIAEAWRFEHLNPVGLRAFCDPGKILLAKAGDHRDLLIMAEEGLRSGAVATLVCEVSKPIDLTAGRRLQLAAETGGTLGLFLIQEGLGSHAAETRWHCQGEFNPIDSTRMVWMLNKNKSGTLRNWTLRWDEQAHRIIVVSSTGE